MKVTEKIASHVHRRKHCRIGNPAADNASQFLDGQAEDARRRLEEYEAKIAGARASGRPPSKVLEVEFLALAEVYKSLLLKPPRGTTDGKSRAPPDRRAVQAPRCRRESLRRRVGPDRRLVNAAGALGGLGRGSRSRRDVPPPPLTRGRQDDPFGHAPAGLNRAHRKSAVLPHLGGDERIAFEDDLEESRRHAVGRDLEVDVSGRAARRVGAWAGSS